jgi:hypothetical protein
LNTRSAAFATNIVDVVLYNIFQRLDVGVGNLGKVSGDIVVEVDFDVGV